MKTFHLFTICFLLTFLATSQEMSIDRISKIDAENQPKIFIQAVLDIPYDEAVKSMNRFEQLVDKSIDKSKQLNDRSLLAQSYLQKALALHFSSKDEKGIEFTLKAIEIFEKLDEAEQIANSYLTLGWKLKHRKLEDAFLYMKKGMLALERLNATTDLVGAYNNFGVLYQLKNIPDSALYFHRKSLTLAKELKDSIGIPFAHTHISSVLTQQAQFELAKKHIDSSLVIRKKRGDIYGITDSYLYLGDVFYFEKQYKKAVEYFLQGYSLAQQHGYFPLKKYAAEYLYKSYDSLQNFQQALYYSKQFHALKDSVLNKETNERIAELKVEFETLAKEKEIAEQQVLIEQRTIVIIVLVGSTLLLAIVLIVLYKRSHFKQQQLQKEMDLKEALAQIKTQNRLQEQRLEISRDLHDNIGAQLTFIISSIDNLKHISKETSEKFKEKLTNISGFTTETIGQLRDTIWAMNKNEIPFDELYGRLLSYVEKVKEITDIANISIDHDLKFSPTFSSVVGMNLFRVVQESINNAVKHAHANEIKVYFSEVEEQLHISIQDDGDGFDKSNVEVGNGLSNIESRISAINGTVTINSKQNQGTEVLMILHL
jgi:signal transduction histidine kinase